MHRLSNRLHNRRGVAMLLVLISLMMATILTTAYLASRDNSAFIGSNVAESAAARWAALTGVDLGVAVLETDADWRTDHTDGNVFTDYPLAGAEIDLDVKDIETDLPPTSTSEYIQLTATAEIGDVTEIAVATAYVPLTEPDTVDVDLSEFAVFVEDDLVVKDDAIITRWLTAPQTVTRAPINLATQDTSAGSITVMDNGAVVDGTVFHGPGASASLVNDSSGPDVGQQALLDAIPMPASPSTGEVAPVVYVNAPLTVDPSMTLSASNRYDRVEIKNGKTLTLQGSDLTIVTDRGLEIETNAKLVIDGNAKIVLFNNLVMTTSAIELKPGATLQLFVGGKLDLTDAYIGEERGNNARDNSGKAAWIDPTRIQIYSLPPRFGPENWNLDLNTVVKGSIYAPDIDNLDIIDQSALYGRVASTDIMLGGVGAIFYDPSLNLGRGFTQASSMVFDGSNRIKSPFKTLASLSTTDLQIAADLSLAKILPARKRDAKLVPISWIADLPAVIPPAEPHPRDNEVEYEVITFGWEPGLYE